MRLRFARTTSSRSTSAALLAATAALAACASGGGSGTAAGTSRSTVSVDGGATSRYETQLTREDRAASTDLGIPADRAYAVLPIVYEQLGLAINTAVTETRTIGVNAVRLRRVGKEPMSRFLSCGSDATGTPHADSYTVTLTVLSSVSPSGTTGSVLATQVSGTAQPVGTSGAPLACSSTGLLEDRIAKTVLSRAAG